MVRQVSIGRSAKNDIIIDDSCIYVSNNHAVIFSDDSNLFFKDISTNGTLINNIKVNHETKQIFCGDIILLAGKYLLKWDDIYRFFPSLVDGLQKKTYVNIVTEPKHVIHADYYPPEIKIGQPLAGKMEYESKNAIGWLIAIYIFVLLGGLLGVIFGIVVYNSKITLSNGTKAPKYKDSHRAAALIGAILASISFLFYITR